MGKARNWTAEETERLCEEWGRYSVPTQAKRLNRSVNAILIKVQRLGLGRIAVNSDKISLCQLLKELKMLGGYSATIRKMEQAGLHIYYQRVINKKIRMIDLAEFWKFAENNKNMFDFSRLEENALGEEPEWVKKKRAEDYKRSISIKPHNAKWTPEEDETLLRLLRQYRYTYPEISKVLKRSEGAIQRRVNDLKIKYRPVKADNHDLWTAEQLQMLCDMIKTGNNYENMRHVIGKSAKAIRGKVFTVYLTEKLSTVVKLIGEGDWGDGRPERKLSQKNCMTIAEKEKVKQEASKLVSLLAFQVRKQFDDQDNWQRSLCRHWDKVKGCVVGETNCDDCPSFERIRPQYCVRCGATFFERQENRICERCRIQRKKAGYRKYMRIQNRKGK